MDKPVNPRDIRAEQESKRARGALSCAECRRLKLRCDKKIPCSSCQRRGCASICPNGSLTTGQGTRFVLADTEHLHKKVAEMSDRIRSLEEGLGSLQSMVSTQPHPLLRDELLNIKTMRELHANPDIAFKETKSSSLNSDYIDAFGTLAIRDDGASRFYGRSAGSESLLIEEEEQPPLQPSTVYAILPDEVIRYSEAFPFSSEDLPQQKVQALVESFLPPYDRAYELCLLYIDQAPWFFGPVTQEQLMTELFPLIYRNRDSRPQPPQRSHSQPSPSMSSDAGANYTPHDLALLFIIFATGALGDQNLPPAPNNAEAEHYYQLTRAALTLDPVLERAPGVTTVQTLALMAIYLGNAMKENSIESTWSLMGLTCTLAQSIGLHRDSSRWKLDPKEVQKRRALFWELFITDSWQSLATGRPPSFTLPFIDCELPQDPHETLDNDGKIQPSFPAWKARFGKECLTTVVEGTLTARTPKYANILDIDRRLRDFVLPNYSEVKPKLHKNTEEGLSELGGIGGLAEVMKHYMPINYRAFVMVYLHRSFFAQALCDHPIDPFRSQYAPSFLAAYDSACGLLSALKEQFGLFPSNIARFWPLWTHAFSSAVVIGSIVTRAPRSKVAPAALVELTSARALFEKAAPFGGRAPKMLPILVKLHEKAQNSFANARQYVPSTRLTGIRVSDRDDDVGDDELAVFAGRARLVETRNPTSAGAQAPQGQSAGLPGSYTQGQPNIQSGQSGGAIGMTSSNSGSGSGNFIQPPPTYASSSSLSSSSSMGAFPPYTPDATYSEQIIGGPGVMSRSGSGTMQMLGGPGLPGQGQGQVQGQMQAHSISPVDQNLPSFDNAHPHLVDQLHGFEGRLAAQMAQGAAGGGSSGVCQMGSAPGYYTHVPGSVPGDQKYFSGEMNEQGGGQQQQQQQQGGLYSSSLSGWQGVQVPMSGITGGDMMQQQQQHQTFEHSHPLSHAHSHQHAHSQHTLAHRASTSSLRYQQPGDPGVAQAQLMSQRNPSMQDLTMPMAYTPQTQHQAHPAHLQDPQAHILRHQRSQQNLNIQGVGQDKNMPETWHNFMQQLEMPNPPIYGRR